MTQAVLALGAQPGDGTGTPGRAGGTLINANFSELYNNAYYFGADTGIVNSCVMASCLPQPAAFTLNAGAIVHFSPAFANTGPATFSFLTSGPRQIVNPAGLALVGGELEPANITTLQYNGTAWQILYPNNSTLLNQIGGVIAFPQTTAEKAASVTPVNLSQPPGNVLRYGADPTGFADSTVAFSNALQSNGSIHAPAGTYTIGSSLSMFSGQTLYGDGSATVLQYANAGLINISMQNLTKTVIRDLKIVVTGAVTTSAAGVYLQFCTDCTVERVEMTGCQGYGVWIDCSNYCQIENNYFHGFGNGVTSNYADIGIYCQSSTTLGAIGNRIINNVCLGGGNEFGISLEDPDSATSPNGFPTYTLIQGNKVGPHTGYGILHYMSGSGVSSPGACDTYNSIIGNTVQGITGAIASNPSSGAGIYSVGIGSGAVLISNNTVFNCCVSTGNSSLAPAAIGINGNPSGVTRPVVSGNIINGMTQGDGIRVVSCLSGAIIIGNSINMPSNNRGTGPGGAQLLGNGITVENSANVSIGPNEVQVYGLGAGLFIFASGGSVSNVNVTGGNYMATSAPALDTTQALGFNINRLTVSGASFISNGTSDAISLNAVIIGNLANCVGASAGGRGLFLNGSLNVGVTGGTYSTTGATAIGTSGTCTGSFVDRSADFGGVSSLVSNAGTGCIIEWYVRSSTVPTTGIFAVGDHAIPITPVVGTPKGWYCTAAGTPGTQTSEGNL